MLFRSVLVRFPRIRLLISSVSGHLQIGGGITADNAREWLDAGANKAGPPVRLAVAFDAQFGLVSSRAYAGDRDLVSVPGREVLP